MFTELEVGGNIKRVILLYVSGRGYEAIGFERAGLVAATTTV